MSIHDFDGDCNSKRLEKEFGTWRKANLTIQGQLRAFREDVSMRYKTEIGPDHVLMGWMVRHCAWVVNNFQVKRSGRTPYRSILDKDYTREVVPLGEILEPNWSWCGCEEFLSTSLTAQINFCCWRRQVQWRHAVCETSGRWQSLEFAILESVCWQSVELNSKEHAANTNNPTTRMSWTVADVQKVYLRQITLDKYGRTAGCPGCLGIGQHTEECRARVEQGMVDKDDAIKIEASEELWKSQCKFEKVENWWARYQSRWGVELNGKHTQEEIIWARIQCEWEFIGGLYRGSQQPFVWRANCRPQPRSHCTER